MRMLLKNPSYQKNAAGAPRKMSLGYRSAAPRRGFILVVALFVSAVIAGAVMLSAALVRHNDASVQRSYTLARAQALYALDVACAQLQAEASGDTSATAGAALFGEDLPNGNWSGVWKAGASAPIWLVSGTGDPSIQAAVSLSQGWCAPRVEHNGAAYAYAIEDLSERVSVKTDTLESLSSAFGDDIERLRRQTVFVPLADALEESQKTQTSFGVLSNPLEGGLKTDFSTLSSTGNSEATAILSWLADGNFQISRPLIWARMAMLMGVYHDGTGIPQLGLAFWANAWNPYTRALPFNARGTQDLQLRLIGPSITLKFLDSTGTQVGAPLTLSLTSHTLSAPQAVDLYGSMAPGEVRFITHYRMLPISTQAYASADKVLVTIGAGNWKFIFETLEGQDVQTLDGFTTSSASQTFPYNILTAYQFENYNTVSQAQWAFALRLRENIDEMIKTTDPRASLLACTTDHYLFDSDPFVAKNNFSQTNFVSGGIYRDGASDVRFDLPIGNTVSIGPLRHKGFADTPPLSLGTAAAGEANALFDRYFFSTLPADESLWYPAQGLPLPNANLRAPMDKPLLQLRATPAQTLLLRGAFNINTADTEAWAAVLPRKRYTFEFLGGAETAFSDAQAAACASKITAKLRARGKPWMSLSEFTADNALENGLLPEDVFCRTSALLQSRGDTFLVRAYGEHQNAKASLEALVQRLATGETQRKFQVLSLKWTTTEQQ